MIKNNKQKFSLLFSRVPLTVHAYRGYASRDRFLVKGRVLEDEIIQFSPQQTTLRTLINNFKRFGTDELKNVPVRLHLAEKIFETQTDREGYFEFDKNWPAPNMLPENLWAAFDLEIIDPRTDKEVRIKSEADLFFPARTASYGIISDVDDTVLQTHATSRLRLKMIYATFFLHPHRRQPMEGIPKLYSKLERGVTGQDANPFFYVSNSPWNIYDNIERFLAINQLPKGPILLRDYGRQMLLRSNPVHKLVTISHILETYPDLPFLMLGDTASKDADYYLKLADQFPGRIKGILIRRTRDNSNARRVARLLESRTDMAIQVAGNSKEMEEWLKERGFI